MFKRYRQESCYLIAEIGGNFTTLEQAFRLVDAAAQCGVDAIKLQTYRADTVASKSALFDMENTGIVSQHELFKKYEIGEDLHRQIFGYAGSKGLDWFSTPSHQTDVDMLERLGVGAHKIGSDDAANLPFLKYVAATGKPLLLSTGMCKLDEVREAVAAILATGNKNLTLLHAITSYPTHPEHVNLRAMQTLAASFPDLAVGYSDHTLGPVACICAAAMGARVLEKHFTFDQQAEGPDHVLSADPAEMRGIVEAVRSFEVMRGSGVKEPAASEKSTRVNNRKSLVVAHAIKAGETFTAAHLSIKRPGYGIAPKCFDEIVGRIAEKDLAADEVLTWEALR